ncbi:MAG: ThuA domain-containing protein [Candidatus Aminicenantes bacterium]|nr:ThuA domain-containing protein [Candidatus Aminicenantes bacterium]
MNNDKSISRRAALRNTALMGAGAALGAAALPARLEAGPAKADVLAVIGDRWHSFDFLRTAFTRTLVKEGGATVEFAPAPSDFDAARLAGHKILLMLCDGLAFPGGYTTTYPFMEPDKVKIVSDPPVEGLDETAVNWLAPAQGKVIREFVEGGGSAWFFHNANYISGGNIDFRHVEGALFTGHTGFRPYKMKIVADHPITRGVKDFVVTEEQHYLIYDKDPKTVLVRSVNEEGLTYKTEKYGDQGATCEACWAYDLGKGRVCYMAPGHTIPGLWNPEYIKLQKNALRWLLRKS